MMISHVTLLALLQKRCEQDGVRETARQLQVPASTLSMVLAKKRRVSAKIARALGWQPVVRYYRE